MLLGVFKQRFVVSQGSALLQPPEGRHLLCHLDVGLDSAFLRDEALLIPDRVDAAAKRQVPVLHRDLQHGPLFAVDSDQPLHAALAVGALADEGRPVIVLQAAAHDLRGAGAVLVHQADDGVACTRLLGWEGRTLGAILGGETFLGDDGQLAANEEIGDLLCYRQVASWIVAKVDDESLEAVLFKIFEGSGEFLRARAAELVQLDVANLARESLVEDRGDLDGSPAEGELPGFTPASAQHLELDLGSARAS